MPNQPIPFGGHEVVHPDSDTRQNQQAIVALDDGGWTVAWLDLAARVYRARSFDAEGAPRSGGTDLSLPEQFGPQQMPLLIRKPDGSVLAAWDSGTTILARTLDPADDSVGPVQTLFASMPTNPVTPGLVAPFGPGVGLVARPDGGHALAFPATNVPHEGIDAWLRFFNAEGQAVGPTLTTSNINGSEHLPEGAFTRTVTLAALADGHIATAWLLEDTRTPFAPPFGIQMRIVDPSGALQGDIIDVPLPSGTWSPRDLGVTALADGGLVIWWYAIDGSQSWNSVFTQIYDADGTARGEVTRAIGAEWRMSIQPDVAATPDGGFIVVAISDILGGSGSSRQIVSRRFDADGAPVDDVSGLTLPPEPGVQRPMSGAPRIAVLRDGGFVVTWTPADQAGGPDDIDVLQRRFAPQTFGNAAAETLHADDGGTWINGRGGDDLILGGSGPDTLLGEYGADTLRGEGGDDALYGGAGDDNIGGGAGNDLIFGGDGDDIIWGGLGDDTVYGDAGKDTIHGGGTGTNQLFGGDGDDVINAGSGGDAIEGGDGNDTIRGGAGNDTVYGGDGNDNIGGGAGDDQVYGGDGDDILWGGLGNDTVYGDAGNDTIYGGGNGTNWLFGGDGDDLIFAGSGGDFIRGGEGNDTIRGSAGNDTIEGVAGNNNIGGDAGDDLILGGTGHDVIWGGIGSDSIDGGGGNDTIYGGGNGHNRLSGGTGNDLIFAGSGGDSLSGGSGDDTLRGGIGDDTIDGGDGDDNIGGGAGNDLIFASGGNNVIWGGAGNDTIHAGTGRDVIHGGPGADVFVFRDAAHIGIGATRDVIADFTPGEDRIDLSQLGTTASGTTGLLGGGQATFWYFAAGGLLIGDQSGDGVADWVLELTGRPLIGAGDLLL